MTHRTALDDLEVMREEAALIVSFVAGLTVEAFVADAKTIRAVTRSFEIIGEAAKNLPATVLARHPEVPWKPMKAFRDLLAHKYWTHDMAIIWGAATNNVPPLIPMLDRLIAAEEQYEQSLPDAAV